MHQLVITTTNDDRFFASPVDNPLPELEEGVREFMRNLTAMSFVEVDTEIPTFINPSEVVAIQIREVE